MTIFYWVQAHETDTLTETVFEGKTPSFDDVNSDDVNSHAEQWAAEYYGRTNTTWSTSDGDGRYLVGRMQENGDREPVTCVITVEQEEIDDEDLDPW